MKCDNCQSEMQAQAASQVRSKGCKVLTNMTTILTVQCDKCNHIQQIPIKGKSILSVKKDE